MKLLTEFELHDKGIRLSSRQLKRREDAGQFPKRVRLSHRHVGWVEEEIDEWLRQRSDEREAA